MASIEDSCVHCINGDAALAFLNQEPPLIIDWFWSTFMITLYTRMGFETLAWIIAFNAVYEAIHVIQAWSGASIVSFYTHAPLESLQISYPLAALCGVLIGNWFVRLLDSPVFIEPYFYNTSPRILNIGGAAWFVIQLKYSIQLILVGYLPGYIAFYVVQHILNETDKVLILVVWGTLQLLLTVAFMEWNTNDSATLWKSKNTLKGHRTFFKWIFVCLFAFWFPILILVPTGLYSHLRTFVGIGCVSMVLAVMSNKGSK